MYRRRSKRLTVWIGLAAVTALAAAACGGDEPAETTAPTQAPAPAETTAEAPADTVAEAPAETAAAADDGAAEAGSLAGLCPDPLVVQLDWEPESEHGGVYELVGGGYTIDNDKKAVTGPLTAGGVDTGIDIEVRIGGFAVGFQPVQSLLYQDQDIFMGFVRLTEAMATWEDLKVVSVMATFDKSAFAVYWDPETYPNVSEIADLKDEEATILLGRPDVFHDWWIAEGIMDESQMDLTDQPKPAAFIGAGGSVAEAGFATAEPYIYQYDVPEWGKPVRTQLIHDTGFREYFQAMGLRAGDIDEYSECLSKVVPILQQAHVDFLADPAETIGLILELVDTYDTGWVYTQGVAEFAVETMLDLGIMGNGPNNTIGDFEMSRVQELLNIIDEVTDANVSGLAPDELATNRFIDPAIGVDEGMTADAVSLAGSLAGLCPDPLVVQLDWEPESEHGGVYELVGGGYTIDNDKKAVTGPLTAGGVDTGIDIEVRIGGFAVGFQPVQSLLYQDQDIFMGFVRLTEAMATWEDLKVVSVMATFDKSAFAVYWDPETYPNVSEIADLKDEEATILLGRPDVFHDWWIAEGIMDESQMDLTDQPKPAAFIGAGGSVAEAGFATAEPYIYQYDVPEWGKPVRTQLIHDTGFREYFQAMGLRAGDIDEYSECLSKVVPILQQAHVDFLADPAETIDLILELVDTYDTGWVYTQGVAEFAVETMLDLGIMGNGPNNTIGDFEMSRVQELLNIIDEVTDANVSGLAPDELATNRFIDPAIGL